MGLLNVHRALPWLCLLLVCGAVSAAPTLRRPLTLVPSQLVSAVRIRSVGSGATRPLPVTDGSVLLPTDLPLPWQVELTGFESVLLTAADLEHPSPIVLRALGTVHATVEGGTDKLSWLLQRTGTSGVQEIHCPRNNDVCEISLPAGVYFGIVAGAHHASRIRTGIIVQPGQTTDLGNLQVGPTRAISFRVMDSRTNAPIWNATATWDPPMATNSDMARTLYARRWSGTTDTHGRVTFTVGPLPLPVRWRISAPGFATQLTPIVPLRDDRSPGVSDVRLQTEAEVTVRVVGPRHGILPHGSLLLQEPTAENSLRYRTVHTVPLHAGETTLTDVSYGEHRVAVTTSAGRTLCYEDFSVAQPHALLELAVEPLTVHGVVHRGGDTVSGAHVYIFDPANAEVLLAQTLTDDDGAYTTSTFQRGSIYVSVSDSAGTGQESFGARRTVDIGPAERDITVDLDVPTGGLTIAVFDLKTDAPIPHALVDHRITYANGEGSMGRSKTDEHGRLILSGHPQGTAALHVEARGYRSRDITATVPADAQPLIRVDLQPAGGIDGTVVDSDGRPVPHARVSAGYQSEFATQPYLETTTNDQGLFHFDSPPEIGTIFYATAPGHALGAGVLHTGDDNLLALPAPTATLVYVIGEAGPLTMNYRITAAPLGGTMIPMGVLNDLAEAQSMTPRQLAGTAKDGALLLPEFLSSGSYELFAVRRVSQAFVYDRVGTINVPRAGKQVLVYHEAH
jgi:hypothetical protein